MMRNAVCAGLRRATRTALRRAHHGFLLSHPRHVHAREALHRRHLRGRAHKFLRGSEGQYGTSGGRRGTARGSTKRQAVHCTSLTRDWLSMSCNSSIMSSCIILRRGRRTDARIRTLISTALWTRDATRCDERARGGESIPAGATSLRAPGRRC